MDVSFQIKKDKNIITITNTKMKDHEPPLPESYKMNQVELLYNNKQPLKDEEGKNLTSILLEQN